MTDEKKPQMGSLEEQLRTFGKTSVKTGTVTSTQVEPFASVLPQVDAETVSQTVVPTEMETFAQTYVHNKRGRQAFERTHKRTTFWVLKPLAERLRKISRRLEISQTELIEEGIQYLLKKYEGEGRE